MNSDSEMLEEEEKKFSDPEEDDNISNSIESGELFDKVDQIQVIVDPITLISNNSLF